ncbi:MAG TPA: hypothetical protein VFT70_18120 [Nocardioides sp.]|nr:hypothetical protein [Nocardioides sp.]
MRSVLGALLALVVGSVAWASDPVAPEAPPAPEPWLVVSSPTDATRRLLPVPPLISGGPSADVVVHPDDVRQAWWGTGATLTDSSVELLRGRPGLLRALFDPRSATGARLNMLRLPLSATDFSQRPWTWKLRRGTARPPAAAHDAVALVQAIRRIRPGLRVVGTPWSAPATMKTSGTVRGGALADAALPAYARLLVGERRWLRAHGVPLWAMTLGNEPGYSTDYASMTMTDQQMVALADRVGPAVGGTRLWALDHNWSDRGRVDALLAGTDAFDGAAFHCYGGQPAQMAGLAVPRLVTECTGTTDGAVGTFAWDARNLVSDAVAAGSSGLMMWNLALDSTHGPVDPGSRWGCRQCRGLLTLSPTGGTVREPEFATLAHLARAATPGAHVVGVDAPSWLNVAAFRNADGSVGVFGQNSSGVPQTVRFTVGDSVRSYRVGAGEMFSYRLPRS